MRILIHVGSTDVDIDISSWSSSRQKTSRMTRDNLIVKGLMQYFISDEGICLGIRDTGRFACVSRVFGLTSLQYDDPFIKRVIDARLKQCPTLQPTEATYNGISECWRFICCSTEASRELTIHKHGPISEDNDEPTSVVKGLFYRNARHTRIAEIIIPEVISAIGSKAFMGSSGIKVIIMPNRVKRIGSYAFAESELQKCIFPTSPIDIGFQAFAGSSIKKAIIPANSTICKSAFKSCRFLRTVEMPKVIQAIGPGVFAECECLGKMSLPGNLGKLEEGLFESSGLTEITIPASVVSIGASAFRNTPIREVLFEHASMLTTIESLAFKDCDRLRQINLPRLQMLERYCFCKSGLQNIVFVSGPREIHTGAFFSCESLKAIEFTSQSRTIIGASAFQNCHQLVSIQMPPQSVSTIRRSAFASCQTLRTFHFPAGIVELGEGIFRNNINMVSCTYPLHQGQMPATIPDSTFCGTGLLQFTMPPWIQSIGNYAFQDCGDLSSVEVAASTTAIGHKAFQKCHLLKQFNLQHVTSIGSFAFDECYSLVVIEGEWMNHVTKILTGTFRSCLKLHMMVLPEGITEIGDQAFSNCISLGAINFPSSLSSIGSSSFKRCKAITTITLPQSLNHIGQAAFTCCRKLQFADLSCELQIIPAQTFEDCISLKAVKLPGGLITIGSKAFRNCKSLTTMNFPESLIKIEALAFDSCDHLASATLPQEICYIGMGAFLSCCALNNVTLPNSTLFVHTSAFLGCRFIPDTRVQGRAPRLMSLSDQNTMASYDNGT